MTKKFLLWSSILALTIAGHFFANGADVGKDKNKSKLIRRESAVREMPDSLFTSVEMEDLLDDEVYVELAKEGMVLQRNNANNEAYHRRQKESAV